MEVVIAGPAKSGTTALFATIRGALEPPVRELFEARRFEPAPDDRYRSTLAKVLIGRPGLVDYASFDGFPKKIGIVRDPAGLAGSVALYSFFTAPLVTSDRVDRLLELLRRKEADPGSVSFLRAVRGGSLPAPACGPSGSAHPHRVVPRPHDHDHRVLRRPVGVPRVHLRSVRARRARARGGLPGTAAGPAEDDPRVARVARTRAAGDWRNWFTPADMDFFRPLLLPPCYPEQLMPPIMARYITRRLEAQDRMPTP